MEFDLILSGLATLEELYQLNEFGYEFVISGGNITEILKDN